MTLQHRYRVNRSASLSVSFNKTTIFPEAPPAIDGIGGPGTFCSLLPLAFPARTLILTQAGRAITLRIPSGVLCREAAYVRGSNLNREVNRDMTMSSGIIEVDLLSRDVDSENHPDAVQFREVLESVAEEYRCRLTYFEVTEGTVSFSFDSDSLMADILKILQAAPDEQASGKQP